MLAVQPVIRHHTASSHDAARSGSQGTAFRSVLPSAAVASGARFDHAAFNAPRVARPATDGLALYAPADRLSADGFLSKAQPAAHVTVRCATCKSREICLPSGLEREQLESFEELVYTRKKVKRGDPLFHTGDAFSSLYAIRSGFFKTRVATDDGHDQVTGFHMAGDLLGMDGIAADLHDCDAIALEDSEVCVIPYKRLEVLSHKFGWLQRHFHKLMSREIVRDHGIMLLLGSMCAAQRLAAFLLDLSKRFSVRGYAASEFILRMTREEIGSYLGLKLETVSRGFSRFQDEGLIAVQQKHIRIVDQGGLKSITHQRSGAF